MDEVQGGVREVESRVSREWVLVDGGDTGFDGVDGGRLFGSGGKVAGQFWSAGGGGWRGCDTFWEGGGGPGKIGEGMGARMGREGGGGRGRRGCGLVRGR